MGPIMGRYTLLLVIENCILRDAIALTTTLSADYTRRFPETVEVVDTEIYAVGVARPIQERLRVPRALEEPSESGTVQGQVHAIWKNDKWFYPDQCPSAPDDHNGATAWQWTHFDVISSADPESFMFVMDVYVREYEALEAA
ncbi:hypothetical protein [Neomicrococcus lactis]|uniref:Uncharacterized protein n=1 Tax=Neomicrococcus lactis TaxID=732241 RepID=A0A7W9DAM5_9MICC|nr:hypothetical protein [Neomicrococcus lactis]MBB5596992.1 hypothetical protein [Neomicrococcus lactis]